MGPAPASDLCAGLPEVTIMATNPQSLATPKEVAAQLGIASSTLRAWSKHFASELSTHANPPKAASSGRVGRRLYNPADVQTLARARDLLAGGLTFERTLAVLRTEPEPLAVVDPGQLAQTGDVARALVAVVDLAAEQRQRLEDLERRVQDLECEKAPPWWRRFLER